MDFNFTIPNSEENEPLIESLKRVKGVKWSDDDSLIIPAEDPTIPLDFAAGVFSHIKGSTKAYRKKLWQRKK